MDEVSIETARRTLGEIVDKARFLGEVTMVTRQGKPTAVIVGAGWVDEVMTLLDELAEVEEYRDRSAALRKGRRAAGLARQDPRWVDHIDGNPRNNDPANLRIVDPKEDQS